MSSIPNANPKAKLFISKWSNFENRFVPVVSISPASDAVSDNQLTIAKTRYAAEYNLKGLECNSNGQDLPPLLRDYLPGAFASKLLAAQIPTWYRSTDFAKMVALGNRDIGCYRIVVNEEEPMDHSLIRTPETLDKVIGKVHLALNKDELDNLLDSSNFYSLTSTRGETPKIEYQDEAGERWVVKMARTQDNKPDDAATKVEQAYLYMLEDCGVNVPKSTAHTTPEGVEVIMTQRFDLAQPRIDPATGIADHANKMETMTFATLQNIDCMDTAATRIESYADAVELLRRHSTTADKDAVELLRRALFDIAVNNTSTNLRNIAIVENYNGYELAPTVGVTSSVNAEAFNLPITAKHGRQSWVKFDSDFIYDVAMAFDLPRGVVKAEVNKLATIMLGRNEYMKFVGMDENQISKYNPSFIKDAAWKDVLVQTSQKSPLEQLKRTSHIAVDHSNTPSMG